MRLYVYNNAGQCTLNRATLSCSPRYTGIQILNYSAAYRRLGQLKTKKSDQRDLYNPLYSVCQYFRRMDTSSLLGKVTFYLASSLLFSSIRIPLLSSSRSLYAATWFLSSSFGGCTQTSLGRQLWGLLGPSGPWALHYGATCKALLRFRAMSVDPAIPVLTKHWWSLWGKAPVFKGPLRFFQRSCSIWQALPGNLSLLWCKFFRP